MDACPVGDRASLKTVPVCLSNTVYISQYRLIKETKAVIKKRLFLLSSKVTTQNGVRGRYVMYHVVQADGEHGSLLVYMVIITSYAINENVVYLLAALLQVSFQFSKVKHYFL